MLPSHVRGEPGMQASSEFNGPPVSQQFARAPEMHENFCGRFLLNVKRPNMDLAHGTRYTIGVDLGGTNLRVAAYNEHAGLLETILLPTRLIQGRQAVVQDMCEAILALSRRHSVSFALAGIGIGTPGPLELPAGRLHNPPNLPGWDGFELRAAIETQLQMPILLESDANLAALAECILGSGKTLGIQSLCMLTLGTGIGNGIIFDGKVWHGTHGMAGEAGHMTIWPDGPVCGCGGSGCLEMYASATAIRRIARETATARPGKGLSALINRNPSFTAREVGDLANDGDPAALQVFELAGQALGIGLAGLVNTLDFQLYVVGGGLANAWELLKPALMRELRHRSYVYRLTEPGGGALHGNPHSGTRIMAAELGSDSGLLGACILPSTATAESNATTTISQTVQRRPQTGVPSERT